MKDLSSILKIAEIAFICVGAVLFVSSIDKNVAIVNHDVADMQLRINRFEARQIHLNDKQDAELQSYWDNLELRIGELQKMQFESCKKS